MSQHQDQVEREVEATLARLATRAVPDTERPPAPPWQQRRRSVDPRRFGRATPWLVAAVLLVIAGLGIGAGVAFEADAPERGPVGTQLPSPTGTTTAPDGTLGSPTSSPTAGASLDRTASDVVPDDGISTSTSTTGNSGPFVASAGAYGPVRVGMTRAEALAALGLGPGDVVAGFGSTCQQAVPMPGTGDPYRPPLAIVDDSAGGTVVGFVTTADAKDAFGNGEGSTLAALEANYPAGQLLFGQAGWTFTALGTGDTGIGFSLDATAAQDEQPAGSSVVRSLLPGTADYARGAELCVG